MYTTCTFCFSALGHNESIEHFPFGRRLAFDADRGRLWVVCRRCERWNLTPLEERWEAVEECERRFRATRLRVSTENIGLARLADGLDLVRVGRPQRPELAAWRYGPRLYRRRLRAAVLVGGAAATGAVLLAAGAAAGVFGGVAWLAFTHGGSLWKHFEQRHVLLRLPHRGRPFYDLTLHDMAHTRVTPSPDGEPWRLLVSHQSGELSLGAEEARRTLSLILVRLNWAGASAERVRDAVAWLERYGGEQELLSRASRGDAPISDLMPERRLAIEMALHEEDERRAIEGELGALEAAWRDAEEVAAIADNLLVPERIDRALASLRARNAKRVGSLMTDTSGP
ncbi:MAG: hypothetical protein M3373_10655 [Gemmatimonadota bacterium]|nr:hypothetical protein [Gemmatimonadota bacterium]